MEAAQFSTFIILMVLLLAVFVLAIVWSQWNRARSIRATEDGNLSLKRGIDRLIELVRQMQASSFKEVTDPVAWAKIVISRAVGINLPITLFPVQPETREEPNFLRADDAQGNRYYISDVTPEALSQFSGSFHWPWDRSRLSRQTYHPLSPLPRGAKTYRLSVENIGATFDLEVISLWKKQWSKDLIMREMWLYVLPPIQSGK
jgi:hypothetical protein